MPSPSAFEGGGGRGGERGEGRGGEREGRKGRKKEEGRLRGEKCR